MNEVTILLVNNPIVILLTKLIHSESVDPIKKTITIEDKIDNIAIINEI